MKTSILGCVPALRISGVVIIAGLLLPVMPSWADGVNDARPVSVEVQKEVKTLFEPKTSVTLLVQCEGHHVVGVDFDQCKLLQFTDNEGRNRRLKGTHIGA